MGKLKIIYQVIEKKYMKIERDICIKVDFLLMTDQG